MIRISRCFAFLQQHEQIVQELKEFLKDSCIFVFLFLFTMLVYILKQTHTYALNVLYAVLTCLTLVLLFCFFFQMSAHIAIHQFGSSVFSNLDSAFYTLFICLLQEDWMDIFKKFNKYIILVLTVKCIRW